MNTETERLPLSESDLTTLGVALVLAMMRSASSDEIDPRDWWTRAKTALETAAAEASEWPALISAMGRELQIPSLQLDSINSISLLGKQVGPDFRRFRASLRRDALYLVAMARMQRQEEREAKKEKSLRYQLAKEENE